MNLPNFSPAPVKIGLARCAIATAVALLSTSAMAQFHGPDGKKLPARPNPAPSGNPAASAATAAQRNFAAATSPASTTTSTSAADTRGESIAQYKFRTRTGGVDDVAWNYNKMIEKADVVWGQAKNHPNGNYTISKVENATLIQKTFTQPRTPEEHAKTDDERQPVERRVVQLDANGRPLEVLIYDIRNQLKFRGVLVYDERGIFREERLFDPSGRLVRTRIQEYDRNGRPLPVKTVIDKDAVGTDISLVLTGNESPGSHSAAGSGAGNSASADGQQPKKSILKRLWPFGRKD